MAISKITFKNRRIRFELAQCGKREGALRAYWSDEDLSGRDIDHVDQPIKLSRGMFVCHSASLGSK